MLVIVGLAAWIAPGDMGLVALLTTAALIMRTVLGLGLTTSAGAVYFDADKIPFRLMGGGELHLFAIAKTYLENELGCPAENGIEIFCFA